MHNSKTYFGILLVILVLGWKNTYSQDITPYLPFTDQYQNQDNESERIDYFKIDIDLYSRIRVNHRLESEFYHGVTSPIDKGSISIFGQYANAEMFFGLKLEDRDPTNRYELKFDRAYLKINNLFDQLLDIRFFDIEYGVGNNYSIRPDLNANGIELTFNPLPQLSLTFGYGIGSEDLELYPMSNDTVQTSLNGTRTTYDPNYHALKFDLRYENNYVPLGIYYGITLVDNAGSYLVKDYLPFYNKDKILHTSVGFDLNLLAYFNKSALRFDMAFALPIGSLSRHIRIGDNGSYSVDREFNFLFQFYGDVEVIYGFGIAYQLLFALDSHTKQKSLGNRYDKYFKEAFKIALTPRYTYGPVSIDLNGTFGIIGGKTARSSVDQADSIIYNKSKVYNNLSVETGVNWTPFPISSLGRDFMVRGYFKFDFADVQLDADHHSEVGLRLKMSFNSLSID